MFDLYLQLGYEHISDLAAYDHILFIITLCAVYPWREWKRILILVTAFTVGHSTTLALAALELVVFPTDIIEFLIPVTILLTAIFNVTRGEGQHRKVMLNYGLALFFGLIHGLGFSNYFRSLLGMEESIVAPLLAFNIGVELGQIGIVAVAMILNYLLVGRAGVRQHDWNVFVSGAGAGVALILMSETWLW